MDSTSLDSVAVADSVLRESLQSIAVDAYIQGLLVFSLVAISTLGVCVVIRLINRGAGY